MMKDLLQENISTCSVSHTWHPNIVIRLKCLVSFRVNKPEIRWNQYFVPGCQEEKKEGKGDVKDGGGSVMVWPSKTVNGLIVDRGTKVNSGVYTAKLSAHIQTNATKLHWSHNDNIWARMKQVWLYHVSTLSLPIERDFFFITWSCQEEKDKTTGG